MLRRIRRHLEGEGGFTLIELIMVIVILAILLALALPSYLQTRKKAYIAEANETLQEMRTAAWLVYIEKGSFSAPTPPAATTNWSYAYGTCTGTGPCTMTATGKNGTPVSGATVTLTLSSDGSASITSSGF